MARLFAVKNLGPAPSMEDLVSDIVSYALDYEDTYDLKDNKGSDQTLYDFVYDSVLQMVAGNPRDALVYLTSERNLARAEGTVDDDQLPMLDRLIDLTKAYIAARGL